MSDIFMKTLLSYIKSLDTISIYPLAQAIGCSRSWIKDETPLLPKPT